MNKLLIKWFATGLAIPILFTLLFNIGLILSIPNIFPPDTYWYNTVNYFSKVINNQITVDVLVCLVTVTIVFFTFAQFSYSKQNLPTNIVREYILSSPDTYLFLSVQTSFIALLAYFTFRNNNCIHTINLALSIFYLIVSVLYSIYYFYWLSKHVSPYGLIKLIIKKLDMPAIERTEQEYAKKIKQYQDALLNIKPKVKVSKKDYLYFSSDDQLEVVSEKTGIVSKINLDQITRILNDNCDIIDEVIFCVEVGKYIPDYELLPNIKSKTVLIKFTKKLLSPEAPGKDERFDRIKYQLEECFFIDEKGLDYKENVRQIKDIIKIYYNCLDSQPAESHLLVDELTAFFVSHFIKYSNEDLHHKGDISKHPTALSENLFIKFIYYLQKEIRDSDISPRQVDAVLTFIYAIKNIGPLYKSVSMIYKLLQLLNLLFYKIVKSQHIDEFELPIFMLRIQEVSISSVVFNSKEKKWKDISGGWESYYRPFALKTLEQATITCFRIIEYAVDEEYENKKKILSQNLQSYLELFSNYIHWEPIEDLAYNHHDKYEENVGIIIKQHSVNIIYLSIMMYRMVLTQKLDRNILLEIGFPFAGNCNTVNKYSQSSDDILTYYFFAYDFNSPTLHFLGEQFESNIIHEVGTYSPRYDFADYWIALSLFRKRKGNNYIPTKNIISKDSPSQLQHIKSILNKMKNNYLPKVANTLNVHVEDINEIYYEYYRHLESIFYQIKQNTGDHIEL